MYYLHSCLICADSEKRDSLVCEDIKPMPSVVPEYDLLEAMSANCKSKNVIFSIRSYCGGKLVKLVAE
jgi:hypothetical protein